MNSYFASPAKAWSAGVLAALLALAFTGAPASGQAPVTARVVDATTGRPLAAVAVTAGRAFALSATDGSFTLTLPAQVREVTVERVGYASASFPAGRVPPEIRLDPSPYLLERLAVEVDRGGRIAAGTSLAATSLDRSALSVLAGTSVAELLTGVEGVQSSRVGSWGSRPVVRGLTGERLAILIDGNRVNRGCTFGMDQGLASIDPAQVETVEIVAGPGSALYGSGSVGGVINVVTRRDAGRKGVSGEIRASASSAVPGGSLGGDLSVAGDRAGASLSLDASGYGDYRTPDAAVDGSSYRQLTGNGTVEVRPTDDQLLSLKGQWYEGRDIGWPMMMGASIPEETRTSLALDYGWQVGRGALDGVSVRGFVQKLDHHMTVDALMQGDMGPMTMKADARSYSTTTGARIQARLVPSSSLRGEVGAEVNRWFAEGTRWSEASSGTMNPVSHTFHTWPSVTITDAGAFAQGESRLGDALTLTMGGRLDRVTHDADEHPSLSETVATGNLGLRAELGYGFGARVSLGLGYRNPDPMELYGLALKPDGFVYRGNADLPTERSASAEVGLTWTGEAHALSATAFRNRLRDMITLVLAPGETIAMRPVRDYTSLGSAIVKGVTASATSDLGGGVDLTVGGAYTRAEDEATGMPLVGIPAATVDATVRRTFGGRLLEWGEVAVEAADAQKRVAASAGEVATPGYAVAHVRAGLDAGGARVVLGVENVLDRSYRAHLDPVRLMRPGRNFFVRVSRVF